VSNTSHVSVLVLFAHPALEKSRVNRKLVRAARELRGVTFHDLYERYPEFDVDPEREQELLLAHDVIVMQHPMYWYSTPALLKQWEDLVLEHGWAYGTGGDALAGKRFISVITTGGPEASYQRDGFHGRTVVELLAPIAQTAKLCKMDYLPPFVTFGTHSMDDSEVDSHVVDYERLLIALRDGRIDTTKIAMDQPINATLDEALREANDAR
jgi:glutathione-regulated potassium-efflux system ancillary protein KefG